ncbi:MAG: hypothetical protein EZS28_008923 [Streblomastix strix]|uniref:Uncharacterized protein n=1 Tax=Streblomastix strix TaxID=222440 RepID=A0A5J4WLV9_9EUKA|nr:MAG: hypothetical protein EZS28_008923 [Streblomastix strix]
MYVSIRQGDPPWNFIIPLDKQHLLPNSSDLIVYKFISVLVLLQALHFLYQWFELTSNYLIVSQSSGSPPLCRYLRNALGHNTRLSILSSWTISGISSRAHPRCEASVVIIAYVGGGGIIEHALQKIILETHRQKSEIADYGIQVYEVHPFIISLRSDFCSFIVQSSPVVNCELRQFNLPNSFAKSFKRHNLE